MSFEIPKNKPFTRPKPYLPHPPITPRPTTANANANDTNRDMNRSTSVAGGDSGAPSRAEYNPTGTWRTSSISKGGRTTSRPASRPLTARAPAPSRSLVDSTKRNAAKNPNAFYRCGEPRPTPSLVDTEERRGQTSRPSTARPSSGSQSRPFSVRWRGGQARDWAQNESGGVDSAMNSRQRPATASTARFSEVPLRLDIPSRDGAAQEETLLDDDDYTDELEETKAQISIMAQQLQEAQDKMGRMEARMSTPRGNATSFSRGGGSATSRPQTARTARSDWSVDQATTGGWSTPRRPARATINKQVDVSTNSVADVLGGSVRPIKVGQSGFCL